MANLWIVFIDWSDWRSFLFVCDEVFGYLVWSATDCNFYWNGLHFCQFRRDTTLYCWANLGHRSLQKSGSACTRDPTRNLQLYVALPNFIHDFVWDFLGSFPGKSEF